MSEVHKKLIIAVTKSNQGGAQRYVYDIASHFSKDKRFSVTVAAGGNGPLFEKIREKNIDTIHIPYIERDMGFLKEIKACIYLFRLFKKEKPDILHLNSSKMGFLGALAGRMARVPKIVFTVHAWPFNETRPYYQKIIFKILGAITVLLAHKTMTVSQNLIKALGAFPFITKKMRPVYSGIPPQTLYESGAFFSDYGIEKNKGPNIVSIGELHMSKGFDRALVALAQCKHLPWTYHIIGGGEKELYLKSLTKSLGLEDRVMFHGFIEDASLYLNSFDLFVIPSRTEALGYVAIEGLYSRLPILASNAGGIPEVLFDDPYTKLIDCTDEKVFKETLLSFLQKPIHVDISKRPGTLRFTQSFMFTAITKVYLN